MTDIERWTEAEAPREQLATCRRGFHIHPGLSFDDGAISVPLIVIGEEILHYL